MGGGARVVPEGHNGELWQAEKKNGSGGNGVYVEQSVKKGGVKRCIGERRPTIYSPFLLMDLSSTSLSFRQSFLIRRPSNSAVVVDMGRRTEGELCVGQANNAVARYHEDRCLWRGDCSGDDKRRKKKDWVLTRSMLHLRGCVQENHYDQDS